MIDTTVKTDDVFRYLQAQTSLESAWNSCDRADWMLWFLEGTLRLGIVENEFDSRVRLFAVWCARACLNAFKVDPIAARAVEVAEAFAQGRASSQELTEARNNASNGATAAGVVGLRKQLPGASAQLCCFHTANVNAFEATRQCSSYHLKAVVDYATQEGAKKLGWKGSLISFETVNAPVLAAVEAATRAGQANALREIIANPFAGKLALRRAARDETGVPLCPDIALGTLNKFYGLRLSETPRMNELSESEMEVAVSKIVVALVRRYRPLIAENGTNSAKREFDCFRLLMLNASDFDPVLDAPAVRAYEIAEGSLF